MANSKRLHVVPRKDGWAVKREGAKRDSVHTDTQNQAAQRATDTAKREGGEVVIHRPDGTIRDSDSFGRDPNPPKDTKH